jgi:hypothetical protein
VTHSAIGLVSGLMSPALVTLADLPLSPKAP